MAAAHLWPRPFFRRKMNGRVPSPDLLFSMRYAGALLALAAVLPACVAETVYCPCVAKACVADGMSFFYGCSETMTSDGGRVWCYVDDESCGTQQTIAVSGGGNKLGGMCAGKYAFTDGSPKVFSVLYMTCHFIRHMTIF